MTPLAVVHVCAKDSCLFQKWWDHASRLRSGTHNIEVWADPEAHVPMATRRWKSSMTYPEVTTSVWHTLIKSHDRPVLYMEPDCWPTRTDWLELLFEEYERHRRPPAMVTADSNPPMDMVGGIGIYDPKKLPMGNFADLQSKIQPGMAFDSWIPTVRGVVKSRLIRHSYAIYSGPHVSGWHAFGAQEVFDQKVGDGAVFHKDPTGSVARWVKA